MEHANEKKRGVKVVNIGKSIAKEMRIGRRTEQNGRKTVVYDIPKNK